MFARLLILLPYQVFVPVGETFTLQPFDLNGYTITVYPFQPATVSHVDFDITGPATIDELLDTLDVAAPEPCQAVRIRESPTIPSALLEIRFAKREFNRETRFTDPNQFDPPASFAFEVANSYLSRLRYVTRDPGIQAMDYEAVSWKIEYYDDDRHLVAADPTNLLCNIRALAGRTVIVHALTSEIWTQLGTLSTDFQTEAWETLILDAEALLPDVNTSVVLAAAALEIYITGRLDLLAERAGLPPGLWDWVNDRGFFIKNPSVVEKFTVLLKALTGFTLDQDEALWPLYKELKEARNSIAHTGAAVVGKRRELVTPHRAKELIRNARTITERIELLLPEDMRRPMFEYDSDVTLTVSGKRDGVSPPLTIKEL